MENYAPSAWAEIIAKAAVSDLGIAALVSLIVGFVVLALFPRHDKPSVRITIVVLLMLFCGTLFGVAAYKARPVVASETVASGAPSPSTKSQTAVPVPATAPVPAPVPQPPPRTDCGAHWSGWIEVGGAVGSPCPTGCSRGDELGQSYRLVGFPPRPQTQHKFQCWRTLGVLWRGHSE
jgi:hypothetical protein